MHFSENQKLNMPIIGKKNFVFLNNIHDIYDLYNHFKRDFFLCVFFYFK